MRMSDWSSDVCSSDLPCAPDSRSNCPQLHSTMEMLVNLSNPKWRDRASNIYAGRIYSNEDVAEAQTNLRGGMIAISNEYSSAKIGRASCRERVCQYV